MNMKREIAASRRAFRARSAYPPTSVERISSGVLSGNAAAQWTTMSIPAIARSTASGSRMSARITSRCRAPDSRTARCPSISPRNPRQQMAAQIDAEESGAAGDQYSWLRHCYAAKPYASESRGDEPSFFCC